MGGGWIRFSRRLLTLFLIVSLVSLPTLSLASQTDSGGSGDNCFQGTIDGKARAKGNPAWMLGGFFCGIFGFLGAVIITPGIPPDAIIGKSAEYVTCFSDAYKSKSRLRNMGYACIGWAVAIPIVLALQESE